MAQLLYGINQPLLTGPEAHSTDEKLMPCKVTGSMREITADVDLSYLDKNVKLSSKCLHYALRQRLLSTLIRKAYLSSKQQSMQRPK